MRIPRASFTCMVLVAIAAFAVPALAVTQTETQAIGGIYPGAFDQFGYSTAIAGDRAVVGAPFEDSVLSGEGAAYVFLRTGASWALEQKLFDSDADTLTSLGTSVALTDTTIVVGAAGTPTAPGQVYVYIRDGFEWVLQQVLTASDGSGGNRFGISVSIEGDTLVAGASGDASQRGAAYVFTRSGGVWTEQKKLTASDGSVSDAFGGSVALSGTTILAGASQKNVRQGNVYVFTGAGSSWSEDQKLTASDADTFDFFGESLDLSNDLAVIGASGNDSDGGAAYVFRRSGGVFSEEQILLPTGTEAASRFGSSVTLTDTTIAVAAPFDGAGSVSVFIYLTDSWQLQQRAVSPGASIGDRLGFSVSLDESTIIAGAPRAGLLGDTSGSAHVFKRSGSNWDLEERLTADNAAELGSALAVDGDTLAIGAPSEASRGVVYVYLRSGESWDFQARIAAADSTHAQGFGRSVALSGDTLAIGATADDDNGENAGAVYVYTRSGVAWSLEQKLTASDGAAVDLLGTGLALEGDTLIAGANAADAGQPNAGAAYVFTRDAGVWTEQQKLTLDSPGFQDGFGFRVALAGDIAAISAPNRDEEFFDTGGVYIFERIGGTWALSQRAIIEDPATSTKLGQDVALSGNTLIFTTTDAEATGVNSGAAYVFVNCNGNWIQQQKLVPDAGKQVFEFGTSVALLGDTALVGAYRSDGADNTSGAAYVFSRSAGTWTPGDELDASDGVALDRAGWDVALTTDEAAMGAPYHKTVGRRSGAVYIYDVAAAPPVEGEGEGSPTCPLAEGEGALDGEGSAPYRVDLIADIENRLIASEFGGDALAARTYVTAVLDEAAAIILRDLNIEVNVCQIVAWSTPSPFEVTSGTEPDASTTLDAYRNFNLSERSDATTHLFHDFSPALVSYGATASLAFVGQPCTGSAMVTVRQDAAFPLSGGSIDVLSAARSIATNLGATAGQDDTIMASSFTDATPLVFNATTLAQIDAVLENVTCPVNIDCGLATEGEGEGLTDGEGQPEGEGVVDGEGMVDGEGAMDGEGGGALPSLIASNGSTDGGIAINADLQGAEIQVLGFDLVFDPNVLEFGGASISPTLNGQGKGIQSFPVSAGRIGIVITDSSQTPNLIGDGLVCLVSMLPGANAIAGNSYTLGIENASGFVPGSSTVTLTGVSGQVLVPLPIEGEGEGSPDGEGQGGGEGQVDGEGSGDVLFSSADINQDGLLDLSELLRIIQFFNADGFACAETQLPGEDGYVIGFDESAQQCTPHTGDYNPRDWMLSLSELLRAIQFFNNLGYHVECGTEDGFAAGPGTDAPCVGPTSADVQVVMNNYCSGCHIGSTFGGLDLTDVNAVVSQPSSNAEMLRITPGSLENSYLWRKLEGTQALVTGGSGEQMPLGGTIEGEDLDIISAWILADAPV